MRVLDIATGTGLMAREALRLTGPGGMVVGADISEGMLRQAQGVPNLRCIQARAEALPVADDSFDFISMGYALRHVPDLIGYFNECHRVLRPGGVALFLEIARPPSSLGMLLAGVYVRGVVPTLCRLCGHGTAKALFDYYWATIKACVAPGLILQALVQAGFTSVSCMTTGGIFKSYVGRRPA